MHESSVSRNIDRPLHNAYQCFFLVTLAHNLLRPSLTLSMGDFRSLRRPSLRVEHGAGSEGRPWCPYKAGR